MQGGAFHAVRLQKPDQMKCLNSWESGKHLAGGAPPASFGYQKQNLMHSSASSELTDTFASAQRWLFSQALTSGSKRPAARSTDSRSGKHKIMAGSQTCLERHSSEASSGVVADLGWN